MKKISLLSCLAAMILSVVGCENGQNGYDGTNYIYLSSEGDKTTLWESDNSPLSIEVMLTTTLEQDLTVNFAVKGTAGVVELVDNPVTIPAGEKTAVFAVVSKNAGKLTAASNFSIAVDAACALPEGVALKEEFAFVVTPVLADALSAEQLAIIDAYKTSTGIDLSKYMGAVSVSAVVTGTNLETGEPLDPQTITGKTMITLSESSATGAPVLKMLENAMGIQDYMYNIFKKRTVENTEYWFDEYSSPSYAALTDAIDWSASSQEVFSMSLDGIALDQQKNISFLGEFIPDPDYPEDVYVHVPFTYSFTAYDRELAAIKAGQLVHDEDWAYDATANPAAHLNNDDVTEDAYEGGNWIEASASISNESLVFTFCFYGTDLDSDYTRVVATYTPNK